MVLFSKTLKESSNPIREIFRISATHVFGIQTLKQQVLYKIYTHRHKRYVIRVINGFLMLLDLNDKGICKDLFLYGIREPYTTRFLLEGNVLNKGDIVLDIGANIGYYVLIEAKLVGKTGKVYAVEPVSQNFYLLKKNLELNNLGNVETYRYALGEKTGSAKIYVTSKMNLSTLRNDAIQTNLVKTEKIDILTVDNFLKDKQNPDLIRMDVEGYEYQILKGMSSTLSLKPKLLMEIHGYILSNKQQNEIFSILEDYGYRPKFVVRDEFCATKTARILKPKLKVIQIKAHTIKQLRNFLKKTKCAQVLLEV